MLSAWRAAARESAGSRSKWLIDLENMALAWRPNGLQRPFDGVWNYGGERQFLNTYL
jgi:hypothetical protein